MTVEGLAKTRGKLPEGSLAFHMQGASKQIKLLLVVLELQSQSELASPVIAIKSTESKTRGLSDSPACIRLGHQIFMIRR